MRWRVAVQCAVATLLIIRPAALCAGPAMSRRPAELADVEARWDAGLRLNAPSVGRIDLESAQRAGCRT